MRNSRERKRGLLLLTFLLLLPAVGVIGGCRRTGAHRRERPFAVLLVTIDTVRADHLSAYGYERDTSPVLAALAAGGARFEHAYCTLPGTDASHTSMLTGLYPRTHGIRLNGSKIRNPRSLETLASRLHAAGYRTASITARVGLDPKRRGIRGFDDTDAPGTDKKWRAASDIVARTRSWLTVHGDQPWFLWVHLWEPHKPYRPPAARRRQFLGTEVPIRPQNIDPPRFVTKGQAVTPSDLAVSIALYDSEIAEADAGLGRVLQAARAHAQRGKGLLIVVAGDHGESLAERQATGDGFGHGASLYEEAVHVPWVVVWKGVVPPQAVSTRVSLVDMTPTLVELAGAGGPFRAEGRSLASALLVGREPARETIFIERTGTRYSDIEALASDEDAVIDFPWKLITAPNGERARLFRLDDDPKEARDLAVSNPARLKSMLDRLHEFHSAHPLRARASRSTTPAAVKEREALRALGYLD